MGLVVGLVAVNFLLGGIWRAADPWAPLARTWSDIDGPSRHAPSWVLGPLGIYLLFWFELVSGVGFDAVWLAGFLVLYGLYAVWLRSRYAEGEGFGSLLHPCTSSLPGLHFFGHPKKASPKRHHTDTSSYRQQPTCPAKDAALGPALSSPDDG